MKRIALILAALIVVAASAYAMIRPHLIRAARRVEAARTLHVPEHMRAAFETTLGDQRCNQQSFRAIFRSSITGGNRSFLSPEKSVRRRMTEKALATVILVRYDDDALFRTYLNEIYLGRLRSRQIIGVRQASSVFFGKDVADTTLAEGALLAAIHRSPHILLAYPERALQRRNLLLHRMLDCRVISRVEYEAAVAAPIRTDA